MAFCSSGSDAFVHHNAGSGQRHSCRSIPRQCVAGREATASRPASADSLTSAADSKIPRVSVLGAPSTTARSSSGSKPTDATRLTWPNCTERVISERSPCDAVSLYLSLRANRDRPRRTVRGSPRPETRPSSDRRCGRTPKRPRVRARAREPGVRPRLGLGPHELHPASGRLPHPDRANVGHHAPSEPRLV
jgi:hypothetical protein